MACGHCGSKGVAQSKFLYVAPSGEQTTYKTELEARAAQIRKGGTYTTASA